MNDATVSIAVILLFLDLCDNQTFFSFHELADLIPLSLLKQFQFLPLPQLHFIPNNLQQFPALNILMTDVQQIQCIIPLQIDDGGSIVAELNYLMIIFFDHLACLDDPGSNFVKSIENRRLLPELVPELFMQLA